MADLANLNSCGIPLLDSEALERWKREAEARTKAQQEQTAARRRREQAMRTTNWDDWNNWADGRIAAYLADCPFEDIVDAAIAREQEHRHKEVKTAIAEAQHGLEAKLQALERRVDWETGDRWNDRLEAAQARGRERLLEAVGTVVAAKIKVEVGRELCEEVNHAVEKAQRGLEAKLAALEQRFDLETGDRLADRMEAAQARQRTELFDTVSKGILNQLRAELGPELMQARGPQNALETRLASLEERLNWEKTGDRWNDRFEAIQGRLRADLVETTTQVHADVTRELVQAREPQLALETRVAALEQRVDWETGERWNDRLEAAQARGRERLIEAVGKEMAAQIKAEVRKALREEVKTTVAEPQHALENKLAALELRLEQEIGDRLTDRLNGASDRLEAEAREHNGLIEPTRKAIADQVRAEISCDLIQAREERRAQAAKIAHLEQELEHYKARPGKLPLVRSWQPESVTYTNDLVSYDGALWQAKRDTAKGPNTDDWVLLARAGRDAVSFKLRGAFKVGIRYRQYDVVAYDGSSFAACRDNPGLPGHDGGGWQLLAGRGPRGLQGAAGPRGHRGDRGPHAEPPPHVVTYKIDRTNYQVTPFLSDGTYGVTLRLRDLFEQYHTEVSVE